MNSDVPSWTLLTAQRAQKVLARAPRPERGRLLAVLDEIARDPFSGDTLRLRGAQHSYRRRVGDWRILFDAVLVTRKFAVTVADQLHLSVIPGLPFPPAPC